MSRDASSALCVSIEEGEYLGDRLRKFMLKDDSDPMKDWGNGVLLEGVSVLIVENSGEDAY